MEDVKTLDHLKDKFVNNKKLSMLDKGSILHQYKSISNMTNEELSNEFNISSAYISQLVRIGGLPEFIKENQKTEYAIPIALLTNLTHSENYDYPDKLIADYKEISKQYHAEKKAKLREKSQDEDDVIDSKTGKYSKKYVDALLEAGDLVGLLISATEIDIYMVSLRNIYRIRKSLGYALESIDELYVKLSDLKTKLDEVQIVKEENQN